MLTGIYPNADRDRRYNIKEAAYLLGINRNTLRRYLKDGHIKGLFVKPNHTFFLGSEINRFWKQST